MTWPFHFLPSSAVASPFNPDFLSTDVSIFSPLKFWRPHDLDRENLGGGVKKKISTWPQILIHRCFYIKSRKILTPSFRKSKNPKGGVKNENSTWPHFLSRHSMGNNSIDISCPLHGLDTSTLTRVRAIIKMCRSLKGLCVNLFGKMSSEWREKIHARASRGDEESHIVSDFYNQQGMSKKIIIVLWNATNGGWKNVDRKGWKNSRRRASRRWTKSHSLRFLTINRGWVKKLITPRALKREWR